MKEGIWNTKSNVNESTVGYPFALLRKLLLDVLPPFPPSIEFIANDYIYYTIHNMVDSFFCMDKRDKNDCIWMYFRLCVGELFSTVFIIEKDKL